ncbi:nickel ABC transporter permease subunit NikC [Edwardsiella piscicida]|uniref:nickel ABC transporter permease subunit NikC n=1 Tax=Edwardsiella piscicida TaxID=1263550 RepID=UPI00054CCDA8|nr:nickel ABC transporter permease subunit NikC [Edwardsiella piscicida]AOP42733.1 nickel ABC transporter permease subunit NikC [Edwardsiella piscicida]EKS7765005.1 nickel ABC transporter permease subunit NikC [Edwardsiella piscicida]EKS7791774.1 nickel ABC transporter permease subunit NikC [Edwardsiella piscicida]ELM3657865.1 nickel ABC transporter permease subunit NikC [Edwardsiella piscicida]ELM3721752.1 nickel ABC transporter permease subunit NikC [Edwardsiella piscicida]
MNFYRSARGSVRLALLLIILLTLIALSSHYWLPHDPYAIDLAARLRAPDGQHWLGTDHLGRDILSRLLAATRVSLGSVLACLLLVLALGLIIGGSAGLLGGRIDQASMRLADMFMTFPTSILSFFMVGVLGTGLTNVIIAIALSHWAWYARMVRSLVITLRQREYILAARLSGAGYLRIFVDHLSGAVIPSLLVLATLDIGHMMLHVAGMSFLGLGVAAPTAEWGVMINDARQYIWTQPLQMFWPGLALFLSVMAFNLVGDALRDHLDPHLVTEHAH